MVELIFLGTSSGTPTKERNVSGLALKLTEPKSWVLIDCGEGTQHQLLHTKLSLLSLKAICITHVHGDHCYGLPGLLASAGMSGRTEPLQIIAPKPIQQMFEAIKEYTQLHLPFEIVFKETDSLKALTLGTTTVTAHPLSHRVPSHAFCFTTTTTRKQLNTIKLDKNGIARGPAWGQLQKGLDVMMDDGTVINSADYVSTQKSSRRVVIAGDNDQPELLSSIEHNIDVLVHESTYNTNLLEKVGPGPQHSSAQQVALFAEQQGIPHLILTHFSARFQTSPESPYPITLLQSEAEKFYKGKLYMAKDFDSFSLTIDGQLTKETFSTQ